MATLSKLARSGNALSRPLTRNATSLGFSTPPKVVVGCARPACPRVSSQSFPAQFLPLRLYALLTWSSLDRRKSMEVSLLPDAGCSPK
jgi:hypothetical protein